MTTKLLAAALLFTAMPTVATAQQSGASTGASAWCVLIVNGRPMYRPCKGV